MELIYFILASQVSRFLGPRIFLGNSELLPFLSDNFWDFRKWIRRVFASENRPSVVVVKHIRRQWLLQHLPSFVQSLLSQFFSRFFLRRLFILYFLRFVPRRSNDQALAWTICPSRAIFGNLLMLAGHVSQLLHLGVISCVATVIKNFSQILEEFGSK